MKSVLQAQMRLEMLNKFRLMDGDVIHEDDAAAIEGRLNRAVKLIGREWAVTLQRSAIPLPGGKYKLCATAHVLN